MIQTLTPQQAVDLMADSQVDVIDVREPNEWTAGHIAQARLVPLGEVKARPREVLRRDGVVFVCARGARSMTAAKVAQSIGLTQIYSIDGGTANWASSGLPLVRD